MQEQTEEKKKERRNEMRGTEMKRQCDSWREQTEEEKQGKQSRGEEQR